MTLNEKKKSLVENIKSLGKVAVAFSSGVDSTLLLALCHEILGENAIAITAKSDSFPEREEAEAIDFCKKLGIKHYFCTIDQMSIDGFATNPPNRCYLCKKEKFTNIKKIANENGIDHIIEGSNTDDLNDYRPGMQAIKELGIHSPLMDAELSKDEIRQLSKEMGLPTASKPAFACLATRFVYGEMITPEKLKMVEKAEDELFKLGFKQVRVRIHDKMARIEVEPEQMEMLLYNAATLNNKLQALGFSYVTMDLGGYKMGSMNKNL